MTKNATKRYRQARAERATNTTRQRDTPPAIPNQADKLEAIKAAHQARKDKHRGT
jgi:hypothetical protein